MSQHTAPQVPSYITDPDDLDNGLAVSANDILERIWHLFISMRTGLVLILAMALLALVGTLLAQVPAGMGSDKAAYDAWLQTVRPRYGGWTTVFSALGFFDIFNSILFRGITVLLITSTVACSINRAPLLWKQATRPRLEVSDAFLAHAPHRGEIAGTTVEQTAGALEATFRSHGFRTITKRDGDGTVHVYADRFRWAPFGTVLAHLSLVVVVFGVLVSTALGGFKDPNVVVPIGTTVDIGHGTKLAVLAESFTDSYYESGQPSDYASSIVLFDDGKQVASQTIRVNQPLRYGDVTFYQSFFGPAAVLTIEDSAGTKLQDGGVPLQWGTNDGLERVGQLTLAKQDLRLFVYEAASGAQDPNIAPGQVRVEAYPTSSDTPVDVQTFDQGTPTQVAGLTMTFVREQQFTGLIAAKDPGVPFVWGGALLLMLGVTIVFFFHTRRLWAKVARDGRGSSLKVAAVVRHDVTYQREFALLMDEIRTAVGSSAKA